MGFLKFLRREKKESLDEMDLPPAPPPLEGFDERIEFPEIPEGKISVGDDMPRLDLPDIDMPSDFSKEMYAMDYPGLDENPTMTMPSKIPSEIHPVFQEQREEITPAEPIPKEPMAVPPVKEPQSEKKITLQETFRFAPEKTVYVKIDKFKAALGSINVIRADLRKSEEALAKIENIKISKDKSFNRIKSSLGDIQKKLIFMDKTLFGGE